MFGNLFDWQIPVRRPNNIPVNVTTVDSLTPPIEPREPQQNSSEIASDTTQSSDSLREETSYSSSELDTPAYQSRKRKEPPSTLQRGQEDEYGDVELRDILRDNQRNREALEEKRMKIEADNQRELFMMRIRHEKEMHERRIQHEKERDERRIQHQMERDERKRRLVEKLFSMIKEEIESNE